MTEKNLEDLLKNESFCAIPFLSMMVNTDGCHKFCCIASGPESRLINPSTKKPYHVTVNSIKETWTSDEMNSIRQAMINGDKVPACSACYKQESLGKDSNRQRSTQEWIQRVGKDEFFANIQKTIDSNYSYELPIMYLDLRLSNLCNLKCRMCSPFNSSQIAKEHFDIWWNNEEYQTLWSEQWGKNPLHLIKESTWQDSNILWDDLIGLLPNLKKVYMTGGEPTLIQNNYRFMKEAIAGGYNDQMDIFFNINCTNVTDEFLSLISQFKNIYINASLDGYEQVNDYIRYPSKWTKVSANFEKLAKLSNIHLNITPVIQVYNVLDCVNMLSYADYVSEKYNKDIGIDFLINWHPTYLNVTILPDEIRKQSAELLKTYKNTKTRYQTNWLVQNSVNSIINLMESPRHENYEVLVPKFLKITEIYDQQRNQSFAEIFPEVFKALNDEQHKDIPK